MFHFSLVCQNDEIEWSFMVNLERTRTGPGPGQIFGTDLIPYFESQNGSKMYSYITNCNWYKNCYKMMNCVLAKQIYKLN